MRNFVALCALFSASLSAMEQPQNSNNNAVPQATTKHVPTLKELCCRKLAQGVAAECEKYGDTVFEPENVSQICAAFNLDYVPDCLDDLIKAAATEGESKSRSITNHRCTYILSESIFLDYDVDVWRIFNVDTQKTTVVIDGFGKFLLSPSQEFLAHINRDLRFAKIYRVDDALVNDLDKPLVREFPLPYCTYATSGYGHWGRGCFQDDTTLLLTDTDHQLWSFDITTQSGKLEYNFSDEIGVVWKLLPLSKECFVCVHWAKNALMDTEGRQKLMLARMLWDGKAWKKEDVVADTEVEVATHPKTGMLLACLSKEIRLYRDFAQSAHYDVIDAENFGPAVFSPDGEYVAIKYCSTKPHIWSMSILRVHDMRFICRIPDVPVNGNMLWPSYEAGILMPGYMNHGAVSYYSTDAARVLALYKKSLEQNNNNTTAKIDVD